MIKLKIQYKKDIKSFSIRFFMSLALMALVACTSSESIRGPMVEPPYRLSEPRLALIDTDDVSQEMVLSLAVDPEVAAGRVDLNLFRTMMNNTELMSNWRYFGDFVNSSPQISNRDRELLIMRLGWLYYAEYEWAIHYNGALNAGLTEEQIQATKVGADDPIWNDFDRAWLSAVDELYESAFITDENWEVLQTRYSQPDLMVMLAIAAHYHMVAMVTNTLGVEVDSRLTNRF